MSTSERWRQASIWQEEARSAWLAFCGDAFEVLPLIPDGSIDLIITDPPYESLEKYRDSAERIAEYERKKEAGELTGTRIPRLRDWFDIMPNERFPELLAQLYRVLAKNAHCYIFCDDETSNVISRYVGEMQEIAGVRDSFVWWKRIIWNKKRRSTGYHYPNEHEFIVFLEKGKRKLNSHKLTSIMEHKRVTKGDLGRQPTPTEKPVGLIQMLVDNSARPGDLLLDPFCGSGATGVAGLTCGLEFIGIDKKKASIDIARERFRNAESLKKVTSKMFVGAE